jgi:hypothetical protein
MRADTDIANPFWDEIAHMVEPCRMRWDEGYYEIGNPMKRDENGQWSADSTYLLGSRFDYCGKYTWTVTDPATVEFVAEHSTGRMVDPLAGTGYWAYLLGQLGVDVVCSDLQPETNHWHAGYRLHVPVAKMQGVYAAGLHSDRALLLSWPPYSNSSGHDVVQAYKGDRVVYIGEGHGGCCGSDELHELFESEWVEVADHRPVQWWGIHDWVTVYDRRK